VTFTGAIGAACYYPLRLIIAACVRLRIHPNLLTFIGVLINVAAGWALAMGHFITAGVIMIVANIFDFIDGKVDRNRPDVGLRRLLGLGHRPVLGPRAVGGPHLPLRQPRPRRPGAADIDRHGVRDDDELHPGAGGVADQEMQGRLHERPGASCSS
jgi:hypothetical protein